MVAVARATGAPVVAVFELGNYFRGKGLKDVIDMGVGGTVDVKGLKISMTPAVHTSCIEEDGQQLYVGTATGFVVRLEDDRAIYFAGDTALFGDMRLIREMYAPEIAFLPIGDHYTMDPTGAALACEMLGVRQVVPMHYGTFPVLTGSPEDLKKLVEPHGHRRAGAQAGRDRTVASGFRLPASMAARRTARGTRAPTRCPGDTRTFVARHDGVAGDRDRDERADAVYVQKVWPARIAEAGPAVPGGGIHRQTQISSVERIEAREGIHPRHGVADPGRTACPPPVTRFCKP